MTLRVLFLTLLTTTVARADHSVDIREPLALPGLEGLNWQYSGPDEVDTDSYFNSRLIASASGASVERWLKAAELPPPRREFIDERGRRRSTELESICFNDTLSFCVRRGVEGSEWRGQTDLYSIHRDFTGGGPSGLTPVARYFTVVDGVSDVAREYRGRPLANAFSRGPQLNNLPSRILLPVDAIVSTENVVRDVRAERERVGVVGRRILQFCRGQKLKLGEGTFLEFLCERAGQPAFYERLKLRLDFRDQDRIDRVLIYERRAPLESCHFLASNSPECFETGETREDWLRWFDGESFDQVQQFIAGQISSGTIEFGRLLRYLPRADRGAIVLEAVTANVAQIKVMKQ